MEIKIYFKIIDNIIETTTEGNTKIKDLSNYSSISIQCKNYNIYNRENFEKSCINECSKCEYCFYNYNCINIPSNMKSSVSNYIEAVSNIITPELIIKKDVLIELSDIHSLIDNIYDKTDSIFKHGYYKTMKSSDLNEIYVRIKHITESYDLVKDLYYTIIKEECNNKEFFMENYKKRKKELLEYTEESDVVISEWREKALPFNTMNAINKIKTIHEIENIVGNKLTTH